MVISKNELEEFINSDKNVCKIKIKSFEDILSLEILDTFSFMVLEDSGFYSIMNESEDESVQKIFIKINSYCQKEKRQINEVLKKLTKYFKDFEIPEKYKKKQIKKKESSEKEEKEIEEFIKNSDENVCSVSIESISLSKYNLKILDSLKFTIIEEVDGEFQVEFDDEDDDENFLIGIKSKEINKYCNQGKKSITDLLQKITEEFKSYEEEKDEREEFTRKILKKTKKNERNKKAAGKIMAKYFEFKPVEDKKLYTAEIIDNDIFTWNVKLYFSGCKKLCANFYSDLKQYEKNTKKKYILLEIKFPDDFPK
jgi:hypothetical protein